MVCWCRKPNQAVIAPYDLAFQGTSDDLISLITSSRLTGSAIPKGIRNGNACRESFY